REIVRIQPQLRDGYNTLGGILIEEGKLEEAEVWLKKGIEVDPNYPRPYYNLAYLYYKQGKEEEALKYLEEAEKRNPPEDLIPKIKSLKTILTGKTYISAPSTPSTSSLPNVPKEIIEEILRRRGK
ncbi:MAG: tetratricopeptide repeat protein, partial [Chloroflexi bacterium]|nr:tetratricopeptide repeat protein [Chloroflexota bacterium]